MLDARRLIVLREVARTGSFSAAAQALWITQPAVSRQIAALERELGRKVLERTPRGLRLTEAGRLLVEHAEAIVGRLAAAEAQLGSLDRLEAGELRLGASGVAAAMLLAGAMARFRKSWPSIVLSLQELPPDDPAAPVKSGKLDLAVAFEAPLAPATADPDVELVHLLDDPLLLALPAAHPLASRRDLRLEELADETWIRVHPEGPGVARAACLAAGFEPRVGFDARGSRVAAELVRAGLGVAFLSILAMERPGEGIVLRELGESGPVRRVVALTRPAASRSPAASAMLDLLATPAA